MLDRPDFDTRRQLRNLRRKLEEQIGERGPEIERRLGWPAGRLSEVLHAEADLRMEDFLRIVDAAGLEPGRLFGEARIMIAPSRFEARQS